MRIVYRSLAAALTLFATPSLRAQAPAASPKPGPMGPGGKMTETSTCEWFSGGFYLVCRSDGRGSSGEIHGLGILGYSSDRKRYTYYGIDNSGTGGDPAYGDVAGDTWTWEGESLMGGQTVKGRYVVKQLSPDKYSWKWEMSVAGGAWTPVGEGTDTRIK